MSSNEMVLYVSEFLGVIAIAWVLRLIPSFRFRSVQFVHPRREGLVSLSLYALILISAVVLVTSYAQSGLVAPPAIPMEYWIRIIAGGIGLLVFGFSLLIRRQPLLSAGWNQKRLGDAARLSLVLALLTIFLRGRASYITNGISQTEGIMLVGCLIIALAEESIFRGFIQLRLNFWMGQPYGWLATALLFVIWTVPFALLSPQIALYKLGLSVVQSLILGYLAQKTGHTLPLVIYRAFSDWMLFVI